MRGDGEREEGQRARGGEGEGEAEEEPDGAEGGGEEAEGGRAGGFGGHGCCLESFGYGAVDGLRSVGLGICWGGYKRVMKLKYGDACD